MVKVRSLITVLVIIASVSALIPPIINASAKPLYQTTIPGYQLVETIAVPGDGSVVFSNTVLEAGVTYKLEAIGLDPGVGDAEYDWYGMDNCTPWTPPTDIGVGINDPVVDGEKTPFWGPFNPAHIYMIDFVGLGSTISVNFHDCIYRDNRGGISVRIYKPNSSLLEILDVNVVQYDGGGPIEMGERYTLNVRLVDKSPAPYAPLVEVTVKEEGLTPGVQAPPFGDELYNGTGISYDNDFVTLDVPENFPSPPLPFNYQHSWNWMGGLPGASLPGGGMPYSCIDYYDTITTGFGVLTNIFKSTAGSIVSIGGSVSLFVNTYFTNLLSEPLLVKESSYSYDIQASDSFGRTDSELYPYLSVVVPQYKIDSFNNTSELSYIQTTFTLIFPEAWPLEALTLYASCVNYGIALDPDPNYTVLAVLEPIALSSLDALPDTIGKQLSEEWLQVIAIQKAIGTSLGRYEGAKVAGDQEWMLKQLSAAHDFYPALNQHLSEIDSLTTLFISELEAAGATLTDSDRLATKTQLLNDGLPQIEQDILLELGFTQVEIATMAQATAVLIDYVPSNWQETLELGTSDVFDRMGNISDYITDRISYLDNDGDGVANDLDMCPASDTSGTVIVDGRDSGVPNRAAPDGCTIDIKIDECVLQSSNHGKFTRCVSHFTNDLKNNGIITGAEKGALESCAAKSSLP